MGTYYNIPLSVKTISELS